MNRLKFNQSTAADQPDKFDPRYVPPLGKSRGPRLYIVGEAPGENEAAEGRPFIGPAGETLMSMIKEAGVDLAETRFGNAVPFRPIKKTGRGGTRNRAPSIAEIKTFGGLVLEDIRQTKPSLILALGRAASALFGIHSPIPSARRKEFSHDDIPLRLSYHPSYARQFGRRKQILRRPAICDLRV